MDFDGGRIQAHGLDANAHDLLALQLLEDPIQHAVLGPAVHAGVDGVPRSEAFGQAAPLAAVLGHIEQGVQQLQVVDLYIAALAGKSGGNMLILRFGDLHAPQHITGLRISVNTTWRQYYHFWLYLVPPAGTLDVIAPGSLHPAAPAPVKRSSHKRSDRRPLDRKSTRL